VAFMKKKKEILLPQKIWILSVFFKLFIRGHDHGIRYGSRAVTSAKQVIRVKLKVTIYIVKSFIANY